MEPPVSVPAGGILDRAATFDLVPLVAAFRRSSRFILIGALVGALAGLSGWKTVGPQYQAAADLLASQPATMTADQRETALRTIRGLIESDSLALLTIQQSGIADRFPRIDTRRFREDVLTVEQVQTSSVLRVNTRLADPALAVRAANTLAQLAVKQWRSANEAAAGSLREQLQLQYIEAGDRLQTAEKELLTFRRANRLEILKADIDAVLKSRADLPDLVARRAGEEARATVAAGEQAARNPILTFNRTIDSAPSSLVESARSQGAEGKDLIALGLRDETANRVFERVETEAALARIEKARLEQQAQQIARATDALKGSIQQAYEQEVELKRLEAELDLQRKLFEEVALRYERARVTVLTDGLQVQTLAPAVSGVDVSRPLPLWLALGVIVGALLAVAITLGHALILQLLPPTATTR